MVKVKYYESPFGLTREFETEPFEERLEKKAALLDISYKLRPFISYVMGEFTVADKFSDRTKVINFPANNIAEGETALRKVIDEMVSDDRIKG